MNNQMKIEERKPVIFNGFRQNCYLVGMKGVDGITAFPNKTKKKYTTLEQQMLSNGFVETLVEKDYPINSESITSYADSADYRNDPAQAIANAPQRVNLGDITQAQEFLKNPQNSAKIIKDTLSNLTAYYKNLQAQKTPGNGVKGKEDSNNG